MSACVCMCVDVCVLYFLVLTSAESVDLAVEPPPRQDETEARVMLSRAVECVPHSARLHSGCQQARCSSYTLDS